MSPGAHIQRPSSDEYDAYYAGYIDAVPEGRLTTLLRAQHDDLTSRLDKLDDHAAGNRYAPEKWSIKEVVGHIVDCERVLAYRALCMARRERQRLPGFDQDEYVAAAAFDGRPLAALRGEYSAVRASTLALFESLSTAQFARRGIASDCPFSVRALAFIIAGHELHHLDVLTHRYGASRTSTVYSAPRS